MARDTQTKLAAARTRLILDKPFLGALVLRLPMIEADPEWCPTTATDARSFYYSAEFIDALSARQTEFVLAHEALHCALSHFLRRQHRVKYRWDLACDYAVNPLLIADGLEPAPGAVWDPSFEGMTAEEIYPCIDENNADEPMDRHVYDDEQRRSDGGGRRGESDPREGGGGAGEQSRQEAEPDRDTGGAKQPPPLGEAERERLAVQWRQRMAGAAQQAMQAGKLGGLLARMVDHLLQPQLPWRMLLARYLTAFGRDDYSYMRPARREGEAILPSLRSHQVDLVVALDTSGSIGDGELAEFLAEIDALKGQMRARVTLLACDAALAEGCPWVYEPWEPCALPESLEGGGGTSFKPVFEWVARQDRAPEALVYFTDAEGDMPAREPDYPVLWLVKGRGKVPWGERIQLN